MIALSSPGAPAVKNTNAGSRGAVQMKLGGKSCTSLILVALLSCALNLEAANPRTSKITLPVMTALTVKLDQPVNARAAANGTGFTGLIKDPVQVDGVTIIPANSSAAGLVNKESQGGGELELNSVFVSGKMYRITTLPIPFNQKARLRAGSTMTFYLVLSLNIAK
jgi:hypothetical protein